MPSLRTSFLSPLGPSLLLSSSHLGHSYSVYYYSNLSLFSSHLCVSIASLSLGFPFLVSSTLGHSSSILFLSFLCLSSSLLNFSRSFRLRCLPYHLSSTLCRFKSIRIFSVSTPRFSGSNRFLSVPTPLYSSLPCSVAGRFLPFPFFFIPFNSTAYRRYPLPSLIYSDPCSSFSFP